MKSLRVLFLVHEDLAPPDSLEGKSDAEIQPWKTSFDIVSSLRKLGHSVQVLGARDDLRVIRRAVEGFEPHIVFNQLIEFHNVGAFQVHVTSYLELLRVPYTGCNPRGLLLARDKALSKKIFRYHRIPTAAFHVVPRGRTARSSGGLRYPLIVKSVEEEAGLGLSQASVVSDAAGLRERVEFMHRSVRTDAIVEEYVAGRELTIGVLGNQRLLTLPVWEMFFEKLPGGQLPIATAKVKWDLAYQKRIGLTTGPATLDPPLAARIAQVAKRVYRALELSGVARLDLRLSQDGRVWVLEANAIPDLASDEDLALSAAAAGIAYEELISRIVNLGLTYRQPWQ